MSALNQPSDDLRGDWRPWYLGAGLWLLVTCVFWPQALSFSDGVGYLGQARLLLEGQFRPQSDSVGFWIASPSGDLGKYPLFFPLLLAPLFALAPALVFGIGVLSTLALSWITARVADSWTGVPAWGLLVLLLPTHTVLARTLTPDALLCAAALGAWWAIERRHRVRALFLCVLLALTKPVGIVLALALVAVVLWRAIAGCNWAHDRGIVLAALLGTTAGIGVVTALNLLATGTLHYAYRWAHPGRSLLSPEHLLTSGVVHVRTLVLTPPLLIFGVWFLWKRRALGPLVAVLAVLLPMSCYWFVDRGRNLAESLVLAPRLILPAVAFLMLGYIDGLHRILGPLRARKAATVLMIAAPLMAGAIGFLHQREQSDARAARAAMEHALREHGVRTAGLNYHALEAAMLSRYNLVRLGTSPEAPCVLLCNRGSSSYREPGSLRCEPEGYLVRRDIGSFRLFVRPDCGAGR